MNGVIYGERDQHIWMVAAPEGNLAFKPIWHSSSPPFLTYHNMTAVAAGSSER